MAAKKKPVDLIDKLERELEILSAQLTKARVKKITDLEKNLIKAKKTVDKESNKLKTLSERLNNARSSTRAKSPAGKAKIVKLREDVAEQKANLGRIKESFNAEKAVLAQAKQEKRIADTIAKTAAKAGSALNKTVVKAKTKTTTTKKATAKAKKTAIRGKPKANAKSKVSASSKSPAKPKGTAKVKTKAATKPKVSTKSPTKTKKTTKPKPVPKSKTAATAKPKPAEKPSGDSKSPSSSQAHKVAAEDNHLGKGSSAEQPLPATNTTDSINTQETHSTGNYLHEQDNGSDGVSAVSGNNINDDQVINDDDDDSIGNTLSVTER